MTLPLLPLPLDDDELKKLAEDLEKTSPEDVAAPLDAALLAEMQGLTEEDEAIIEKIMQGSLTEITPEQLDMIASKAPGLGVYLRNVRQFMQTGDEGSLEHNVSDVLTATGYQAQWGPNWDLSDLDLDGGEQEEE